MEELFRELLQMMELGQEAVLATIIAQAGSAPRGAGARMLVKADGSVRGSIGGGAMEYQAIKTAMEAMQKKTSCISGFCLTRSQVADIGMVCGGDVAVCFQYISPDNGELKALCHKVLKAFDQEEECWLVMDITQETCWQMGLYRQKEGLFVMKLWEDRDAAKSLEAVWKEYFQREAVQKRAVQKELSGRKYYIEPLVAAETVYIFGGGHVAQELVPLLAHLKFRCVVMDDREAFANPRVFPQAKKTIVGDLEHISDYLCLQPRDYVCIMTRGHQYDYYVQRQALDAHPRYIGVMGSHNKVAVVTEKLLEDGYTREEIEACHMPIGVEILAETPAEIAVSIAGELIRKRAED